MRRRLSVAYVLSILLHLLLVLFFGVRIVLPAAMSGGASSDEAQSETVTLSERRAEQSERPLVHATPKPLAPVVRLPSPPPAARSHAVPRSAPRKPELAKIVPHAAPQAPSRVALVAPVRSAPPTREPTLAPSAAPSVAPPASPEPSPPRPPTPEPSLPPTPVPTPRPTEVPTAKPTEVPTVAPTARPTLAPTARPTQAPSARPSTQPTRAPTSVPSPAAALAPASPGSPRAEARSPGPRASAAGPAGAVGANAGTKPEAHAPLAPPASGPSAAPKVTGPPIPAGEVARLNARLQGLLPSPQAVVYSQRHVAGDLAAAIEEAEEEYFKAAAPPPEVLAKALYVIKVKGTLLTAPSIMYVLKKRTILGFEICTGWYVIGKPLGGGQPVGGYTVGPCTGEKFTPSDGLPALPSPRPS